MSIVDYSHMKTAEKQVVIDADAAHQAKMVRISTEKGAFTPMEVSEADHGHLKKIKSQINAIVAQEMKKIEFKEQVNQEKLVGEAYNEVISRKNFFFAVDEHKKQTNKTVANLRAPGNPVNKPNVILPHEHIDVSNYIDTAGLDSEDKLFEMYGYYAYLIDMHIAQIRPENLEEKSYVPARYNQTEQTFESDTHLNNRFFEYYHRWREPTRTWFSETQEIKWQEFLNNRPTTDSYDHDRGTKFDVDLLDEEKFPHVADRLGYPILREEPIERITGIERAPAHPGYQWQPFVQTPSMEPDPTLSFKLGEVIYENHKVVEWVRFWKAMTVTTFGLTPGFYLFEIYAADGAPSLSWMSENWNWWQIPQQF